MHICCREQTVCHPWLVFAHVHTTCIPTNTYTYHNTTTHTNTHFLPLQANGTIVGFPGAKATTENLLLAECDILIPAASEQQITAHVAKNLKAKVGGGRRRGEPIMVSSLCDRVTLCFQVIAEGANGPTTIAAERILHERKVLVIPVCHPVLMLSWQ